MVSRHVKDDNTSVILIVLKLLDLLKILNLFVFNFNLNFYFYWSLQLSGQYK